MEAVKTPVLIYTEQTPNPESLKFVSNRMLFRGTADFREVAPANEWSPLAVALFELPYIKGVYICNNYVTITKEFNYSWEDIMLKIKEFIKDYIQAEKEIIKEGYADFVASQEAAKISEEYDDKDTELVAKIKNLLENVVKPAVEGDGGNIEFKSYKNGVVTVTMQGSCSGCPSSTVTLKSGIEGLLKRMVPEVTEVVQEMA